MIKSIYFWKCNGSGNTENIIHEWSRCIKYMMENKSIDCPSCIKIKKPMRKIFWGDEYPHLLKMWDIEKNIDCVGNKINPKLVIMKDNFHWKCLKGCEKDTDEIKINCCHSWQKTISQMVIIHLSIL